MNINVLKLDFERIIKFDWKLYLKIVYGHYLKIIDVLISISVNSEKWYLISNNTSEDKKEVYQWITILIMNNFFNKIEEIERNRKK